MHLKPLFLMMKNNLQIAPILKWLLKRVIFFKKEFYQLLDKLIYQKQSLFLLHPWSAHRCPFESILFYNLLGRILFGTKEFLALITNDKLFSKSIKLDGFDTIPAKIWTKGSPRSLWPKSPFIDIKKEHHLPVSYLEKITNSYHLANQQFQENIDKTKDWEEISKKFQLLLFDTNRQIKKEILINFRKNHLFEQIIADSFTQVDTTKSYISQYLDAIDLVLAYHRLAAVVDKEILASLSESYAGNTTCVHYRNLRLSEKLLFYAVATHDIVHHMPSNPDKKAVLLDIGTGYGALPVILKQYIPNSCHILVDLPEILVFTAYYVHYHFPEKKIALLSDIADRLDHFESLLEEYDFILIPPKVLEHIPKHSVDLVINTASMGFLSQNFLEFYLDRINSVLKKGGLFYSINKTETCQWGVGMYEWSFKKDYLTILLSYNNRFSYPQWLGRKL